MSKDKLKSALEVFGIYLKKYPKAVISIFVADTIGGVKPFIGIILLGHVTDAFLNGTAIRDISEYIFIMFGISLVLSIIEARCREWYNQKNEFFKELETPEFCRKAVRMDYELLENNHVQDIRFHAVNNSYFGTAGFLMYQIDVIWKSAVSVICAVIISFPVLAEKGNGNSSVSDASSVVLVLILVGLITLNYKLNKKYSKKASELEKTFSHESFNFKYYTDKMINIENHKSIRLFDESRILSKKINDIYREFFRCRSNQTRNFQKRDSSSEAITNICCVIIYVFIVVKAFYGYISVGAVVTYAAAIIRLTKAVSEMVAEMAYTSMVNEYCAEYMEFMNLHDTEECRNTFGKELEKIRIEFKNVSFRYPGTDHDIIKNLNMVLDMDKGKKVAIVGKNGSGKTTLIKVLCGFFMPTSGAVFVNGEQITNENRKKMYELLSVVFQDFNIFSFGIDENITIGEKPDWKKLKRTIELAGLKEKYDSLEKGGKTVVSKDIDGNGVNFSGGEKQKIAIARTLYKDAPFIIMDEPTSALDPVAECEIFEAYSKLIENKCAIYISHRLASCKMCDEIIVLDKGNVAERGNHKKLIQSGGLYSTMWNAQAKYYNWN